MRSFLLDALLKGLIADLSALSDSITQAYFSHAEMPKRLRNLESSDTEAQ